jgi:hypothetical protein
MTEDILMNVIEYVNVQDRQRLRQTCALIQNETKKKVGYLRLNLYYSREYLSKAAFREEVLMSIANSNKQVSLCFNVFRRGDMIMTPERLCAFQTAHALVFNQILFQINQGERNERFNLVAMSSQKYGSIFYNRICYIDMMTNNVHYIDFFLDNK